MKNIEQLRSMLDNWDDTTRRKKVTLSNPVFIKGLALAPVVIAATNLHNAVILCIAVTLLLTPTRIITSLCARHMSLPLKTFFYPFVSAIVFFFVYYFMHEIMGNHIYTLGVYLPILAVDPLIVKNFERTRKESFKYSIINGLRNTAGFIVACLLVGAVRELLGAGTLGGVQILKTALLPMSYTSMGGFMIVACMCALWRICVNRYHDRIKKEVADTYVKSR